MGFIVTLLIVILLFAVCFALVGMLPIEAKPKQFVHIAIAVVLVLFLVLVLLGHVPEITIR